MSIFVPAHNEAGNIEGAIQDVADAAESRFADYEILLVDDGSTDGSGEVADRLARTNPHIRVIHNAAKQGIASGYRTALRLATCEYFGFIPGDREIHVASIRAIFQAIGSADLVVPYHANQEARAPYRRLMTRASTLMINLLFQRRLRYYQGPTVYPTSLARDLPTRNRGFFFLTEMLVRALDLGYTYVEVGLVHQERVFGKSKAVTLANILMAVRAILGAWWELRVRRGRPAGATPNRADPSRTAARAEGKAKP